MSIRKGKKSGFSIVELMVAVAVGSIVSLITATFISFAAEQFYSLIDQNETEQSLLLSSYYLRAVFSQSVKTFQNPPGYVLAFTGAPDSTLNYFPTNTAFGFFDTSYQCVTNVAVADCTSMVTNWPGSAAAMVTPLAIFIRDAGDSTAATGSSNYIPTGVFYRPPNGTRSGRLYVAQTSLAAGGGFTATDGALTPQFYFDHFAAFGIVNNGVEFGDPTYLGPDFTPGASGPAIKSVTFTLRGRYFKGISTTKNYNPDQAIAAAAGAIFSDITETVKITFRDNVIGLSQTGGGLVPQRPLSNLYFYQFVTPSLSNY